MWYVGLDVHSKRSTYCILDENGRKIKSRTVRGTWRKVLGEMAQIKSPFAVCFEASTGYGYLYDRLSRIAERVSVAHPGHLRLIFRSKRKHDRLDAYRLAKLLFLDEVPGVHVPAVEVRAWRGMIEHRERLVRERVRAKNQMRALLRSQGIVAPKGLWTKRGLAWAAEVPFPTEFHALQRDILLERLQSLSAMLKRVEKELDRKGARHSGVVLLRTMPGIGMRTAEAVMAYVADPARFGRTKAVASYFGFVPCQDASADRNRLGHITRQGPATVRRLLTEAVWQAIRLSTDVRAYFERIRRGDPERKKIAVTATAHYLLRVMYAMLRTGEVCRFSSTG